MLDNKLIENALALTGKTMEDMNEITYCTMIEKDSTFSIEKFGWYLLSPEFIEKYKKIWLSQNPGIEQLNKDMGWKETEMLWNRAEIFGRSILEYQHKNKKYPGGNENPLIALLEAIPNKQ